MPFKKGHKLNIGNTWNKGKKQSLVTIQKRIIARKKSGWFKNPDETKKKIGKANAIKLKGRKRSKESIMKQSLSIRKEKHWNWKGGIKKDKDKRKSFEGKIWRENIFKRDNYTCRSCGKTKCEIHPHHIKNYAKYKDLRFNIKNGITLCKQCHREFHLKFGTYNNNRKQMKDFITYVRQHERGIQF